eukprot:CAMPEP_0177631914 /NCGR_PEP_ID=MMETSP0447-20121125/2005_1 /TAXON_ID=0 /ORGANISM="Stygamoeba regulata, Strain BSH-02190019" /LENGTH=495 /DNA_ID=CAMNT_0019133433 /DNA_START=82 /DNA_END=1569 /DNA_ORIENTATION=+
MSLAQDIAALCAQYLPEARALLAALIEIPRADWAVDGKAGMSGGEEKRLRFLAEEIRRLRAVERDEDVWLDEFGSIVWQVEDTGDGVARDNKKVIYFDGHTDTVAPLPDQWAKLAGPGLHPHLGMVDAAAVHLPFLQGELEYVPPREEWSHLVWGRGSADQLAGVVTQVIATKVLLELKDKGALRGIVVRSYGSISEEDNDGGTPVSVVRSLPDHPDMVPDVVVITEATGDTKKGSLGVYIGHRGRTIIECCIQGKSCHGSMPHLGRNPLEWGSRIIADAEAQARSEGAFKSHELLGTGSRTASWCELVTPSDCAVPAHYTIRWDRRLTLGETAEEEIRKMEALPSVCAARAAGLIVDFHTPTYTKPTWRGVCLNNPQIYNAWFTPKDHAAVQAAVKAFETAVVPFRDAQTPIPDTCRVDAWVFSTDGVGYVCDAATYQPPPGKNWVKRDGFSHPPMVGIGPGREQHAHRVGEYVDSREIKHASAMLAMFCVNFA